MEVQRRWESIRVSQNGQVTTPQAQEWQGSKLNGFVKLLRLRCSSGKRGPLLGPTRPLGGPLCPCYFCPTLESLPHLLAVLRRGQQMPSRTEVLGNGAICRQESLGMPR